jgi:hypothetical protein
VGEWSVVVANRRPTDAGSAGTLAVWGGRECRTRAKRWIRKNRDLGRQKGPWPDARPGKTRAVVPKAGPTSGPGFGGWRVLLTNRRGKIETLVDKKGPGRTPDPEEPAPWCPKLARQAVPVLADSESC